LPQVLLFGHVTLSVKLKMIVALVKTTCKHTNETVKQIADLGKEPIAIFLLVFNVQEVHHTCMRSVTTRQCS
jgi:hypothetical protein